MRRNIGRGYRFEFGGQAAREDVREVEVGGDEFREPGELREAAGRKFGLREVQVRRKDGEVKAGKLVSEVELKHHGEVGRKK